MPASVPRSTELTAVRVSAVTQGAEDAAASGAFAGKPKLWNGAAGQVGNASGMRLLVALTTPPIEVEP